MKVIPIIQKISRIKRDISENQTLISTILPIFRYLGWDVFNENRVIFEDMTATKKRVDATFVFEDNSKFLVEVKRLSHRLAMKDFEQLTIYLNSDDNANFGILTNGIDYWIADNKQDGLEAKRVHVCNIFEMTECDLNILRLFFSFDPPYKLKDMNRYINYIRTGLDFGDKRCEKVLEIKNFESDELKKFHDETANSSQTSNKQDDNKNGAFKKPVFAPDEMLFLTNDHHPNLNQNSSASATVSTTTVTNKQPFINKSEEKTNDFDSYSTSNSSTNTTTNKKDNSVTVSSVSSATSSFSTSSQQSNILTTATNKNQDKVNFEPSQPSKNESYDNKKVETNILDQNLSNKEKQQENINNKKIVDIDDEIVKVPLTGKEKIEFFELIERNRAKIFLNGEYHILSDIGFPSLFIKMLRYIMKEIKLYPAYIVVLLIIFHL